MKANRDADDPELRRLLDLGGLDPFGDSSDIKSQRDPESTERAEAMLRRVLESSKQPSSNMLNRGQQRPRRVAAVAVAFAAVATVLIVATVGWLRSPSGTSAPTATAPAPLTFNTPATTDASQILTRLATLRPESSGAVPSDATIERILTYQWPSGAASDAASPLAVTRRETFVFPNGAVRTSTSVAGVVSASGRLELAGTAVASAAHISTSGGRSQEALSGALSEPRDRLLTALAQLGGCNAPTALCLLDGLSQLSLNYVADPALTRRLWRTLATVPGIKTWGTTTDRLGRPALSLVATRPGGGRRLVVLIAPRSGAFLGYERLVGQPSSGRTNPPQVVELMVLAQSAWVPRSQVPAQGG